MNYRSHISLSLRKYHITNRPPQEPRGAFIKLLTMSKISTIPLSLDAIGNILAFTDLVTTRRLANISNETERYLTLNSLWKQKCVIERKGLINTNIKVNNWQQYYHFINRHYGGQVTVSTNEKSITFHNIIGCIEINHKVSWILDEFGRLYSLTMEDNNLVWIKQDIPEKVMIFNVEHNNNAMSAVVVTESNKIYQSGCSNRYNTLLLNANNSARGDIIDIAYDGKISNSYYILYQNGDLYAYGVDGDNDLIFIGDNFLTILSYEKNHMFVKEIDFINFDAKGYDTGLSTDQNEGENDEDTHIDEPEEDANAIFDGEPEEYNLPVVDKYDTTMIETIYDQREIKFDIYPPLKKFVAKAELPEVPELERVIPDVMRFPKDRTHDHQQYDYEEFYDIKSEMETGLRDIRDGEEVS